MQLRPRSKEERKWDETGKSGTSVSRTQQKYKGSPEGKVKLSLQTLRSLSFLAVALVWHLIIMDWFNAVSLSMWEYVFTEQASITEAETGNFLLKCRSHLHISSWLFSIFTPYPLSYTMLYNFWNPTAIFSYISLPCKYLLSPPLRRQSLPVPTPLIFSSLILGHSFEAVSSENLHSSIKTASDVLFICFQIFP